MKIDHVHFYTRNAARTRDWFIQNVGFKAIGNCINQHTHTEIIVLNSCFLVFSSPLTSASPVAEYLNSHPCGVVDIAFRVKDLAGIINRSRCLGIKLLQKIQLDQSSQGSFKSARIAGWNDLQHTLIEVRDDYDYCLPNLQIERYATASHFQSHITNIDHVVLNVAQGKLNLAVKLYQALFKFQVQQSFDIQTSKSGLISQALIDDAGKVQFNINEPTSANSQIQEFIDLNGGSGIQHLALRSQNLIADVARMQGQLPFLSVPQAYYSKLQTSLPLSVEEQQAIAEQQILVDSDRHNPQSLLMQIFTQPIFEQPTFFLEFIERRQEAQGFGQGNFKALFEAVEKEQENRIFST